MVAVTIKQKPTVTPIARNISSLHPPRDPLPPNRRIKIRMIINTYKDKRKQRKLLLVIIYPFNDFDESLVSFEINYVHCHHHANCCVDKTKQFFADLIRAHRTFEVGWSLENDFCLQQCTIQNIFISYTVPHKLKKKYLVFNEKYILYLFQQNENRICLFLSPCCVNFFSSWITRILSSFMD